MVKRLGLVLHWIGFVALVFFIALFLYAIAIFHGAGVVGEVFRLLFDFDQKSLSHLEGWFFWSFWLAARHWPIKLIITGNKSLFPWNKPVIA